MHGKVKMKGDPKGWAYAVQKGWWGTPALSGCFIKLSLVSESFLLLGSFPSENDMGKACP